MAISARLQAFLQASNVKYTEAKHPVAYTAQEIAATQHVPGRQLAKCVLVKTERGPVLAVLPAIHRVDVKKLKTLLGVSTLTIAKEADIKERFPDVEVGAMSPFGNLYEVPVVADRALEDSGDIVFNAGSHTDTITMRYEEFARLVKPKAGAFGQSLGGPAAKKKAAGKAARRKRPRPKATRRGRAKAPPRSGATSRRRRR
ncbi:MAG: YbaK/EbsC family protein [Candidatus Omnitrophica bacterium]|nr:YbaK/EbsC family protein [Candidatus Omnitrophota bacterium]